MGVIEKIRSAFQPNLTVSEPKSQTILLPTCSHSVAICSAQRFIEEVAAPAFEKLLIDREKRLAFIKKTIDSAQKEGFDQFFSFRLAQSFQFNAIVLDHDGAMISRFQEIIDAREMKTCVKHIDSPEKLPQELIGGLVFIDTRGWSERSLRETKNEILNNYVDLIAQSDDDHPCLGLNLFAVGYERYATRDDDRFIFDFGPRYGFSYTVSFSKGDHAADTFNGCNRFGYLVTKSDHADFESLTKLGLFRGDILEFMKKKRERETPQQSTA